MLSLKDKCWISKPLTCINPLHYPFPDPQAGLLSTQESGIVLYGYNMCPHASFEGLLDAALWNAQLKFIIF